jgi:hypothetical protein
MPGDRSAYRPVVRPAFDAELQAPAEEGDSAAKQPSAAGRPHPSSWPIPLQLSACTIEQ